MPSLSGRDAFGKSTCPAQPQEVKARMPHEQSGFWSKVAQKYDRVVDSQIGPNARSMVRERVAAEDRLGNAAEFGCGTGFYTRVLADKADGLVASDLSPDMVALAKGRTKARNVIWLVEDCQRTSFADGMLDTVFISLVLHFTEPDRALAEMHRILRRGGTVIIANLDMLALTGLDRVRCLARILYHGLTGYRVKPPKGFGKNVMSEKQPGELLVESGFAVVSTELIRDASCSSTIPIGYVRAVKK